MSANGPLPRFVRDVLGCGCPDSLLDATRARAGPAAVAGLTLHLALDVGGRLLVYVVSSEDPAALEGALPAVFAEGRRARDDGGFHRFRFVVATDAEQPLREALARAFRALPDRDDREHLHVVGKAELPAAEPPHSIATNPG